VADMVAEKAVAKAVAKDMVETTQDKKRVPIQPRQKGYVMPWDPKYLTTATKELQIK